MHVLGLWEEAAGENRENMALREHAISTWEDTDTENRSHNLLAVATAPDHSIIHHQLIFETMTQCPLPGLVYYYTSYVAFPAPSLENAPVWSAFRYSRHLQPRPLLLVPLAIAIPN